MANYYRGSEIKFKLELEAEGFDMDRDDFKIDVVSGNTMVSGDKFNSQASDTTIPEEARLAVIIFRDPAQPDSSNSSDSIDDEDGWYAIVNTTTLAVGDMKLVAWAYVPDGNADDLIRTDIAVTIIGRLINP